VSQLPELIDYILERFHAGHRRDFETLVPMIAKIHRVHGGKSPHLADLAQLCDELIADIEPHMVKEEQVLFPLLLNLAGAKDGRTSSCTMDPSGPIGVMRAEHERVGQLLDRIVAVSEGFTPPEWACATYRGTYTLLAKLDREIRLHVHLENNVLFPMAADLMAQSV
jgi:regulator of cell morphogenesis and NO signaling